MTAENKKKEMKMRGIKISTNIFFHKFIGNILKNPFKVTEVRINFF